MLSGTGFFFSSRRRHTRFDCDWSSDVCSSDLAQDRSALIGIVGLGYVGLPLAMEFARVGFRVLGFDVSKPVVDALGAGRSHVQEVSGAEVAGGAQTGEFAAAPRPSRVRPPHGLSVRVPP